MQAAKTMLKAKLIAPLHLLIDSITVFIDRN